MVNKIAEVIASGITSAILVLLIFKFIAPQFGINFEITNDLIKITVITTLLAETFGNFVSNTVRRIIPG